MSSSSGAGHLPQPPADRRAPEPGANSCPRASCRRGRFLHHGRNPADCAARRPGQGQPDAGARIRRLGDAAADHPGIAQVTPIGGEVRQYRVEIHPAKLQGRANGKRKVRCATSAPTPAVAFEGAGPRIPDPPDRPHQPHRRTCKRGGGVQKTGSRSCCTRWPTFWRRRSNAAMPATTASRR